MSFLRVDKMKNILITGGGGYIGTNLVNNLINDSYLINDCEMLKCLNTLFDYSEGTLYPDTYFYKRGDKASIILQKSHDRLMNYLNSLSLNKIRVNSLNNEELLILSSIIEKEAGNHDEKPLIAGVFIKRLNEIIRRLNIRIMK